MHISAKTGQGCDVLAEMLQNIVNDGKCSVVFKIPNAEQGAMNVLYRDATIEDVDYGAEFVTVKAVVDAKVRGMLKKYDTMLPEEEEEY